MRQLLCSIAITHKAKVPDALETRRKNMQKETADELICRERHRLLLVVVAIVFPAEADHAIPHIKEAIIGNGDAVRVAADVLQDLSRSRERRLGVNHPF